MIGFIFVIILVFGIIYVFSGLGKLTNTRFVSKSGSIITDPDFFDMVNEDVFGIKTKDRDMTVEEWVSRQNKIQAEYEANNRLRDQQTVDRRTKNAKKFLNRYTFERFLTVKNKRLARVLILSIGASDMILLGEEIEEWHNDLIQNLERYPNLTDEDLQFYLNSRVYYWIRDTYPFLKERRDIDYYRNEE